LHIGCVTVRRFDRYGDFAGGSAHPEPHDAGHLRHGFGRLQVADGDERRPLRHVALLVVGEDLVAGDLLELVRIAQHGNAVGVDPVEHPAPGVAEGILRRVHGPLDFLIDDVVFGLGVFGREGGVHDHVGKRFEGGLEPFGGAFDVVYGLVVGGVRVVVSAGAADFLVDDSGRALGRAFEEHVFAEVA
jgi:hypothetical protein